MELFDVIIIGAGPSGLEAAIRLGQLNHRVLLIEKEENIGGKLTQWDKLFPDFFTQHPFPLPSSFGRLSLLTGRNWESENF